MPTLRHLPLTLALSLAALFPGLLGAPQLARAHATLVIGDLQLTPDPPVPGEAVSVRISLVDPLLVAVEKALVRVEFREIDPEDPFVPASITGTEAREFDSLVQELWETKFKRRMEAAMKEVAQASGHRMR